MEDSERQENIKVKRRVLDNRYRFFNRRVLLRNLFVKNRLITNTKYNTYPIISY